MLLSQTTCTKYGRTPLIRTLVIRIAGYPDRLGPSGRFFLTVKVLSLYLRLKCFPQLSNTYKELCNNDLFVRKLVRSFKQPDYRFFFPTSNCECSVFFFKKIQLSGFSACPVGSPSQLIRISGVLLHAGFLFLFNLRRSQYLKGLCCLVLPENIVLLSAAIS